MGKEIELSTAITDIAAGPFGSNLKVECFVPSGFPIIDGANLKGYKVTDNITKFVTEEKARSLSRSIAHRGDVIVTISGTIGQIAYIPEDSLYDEYLCSQRQFRVSFDSSMVYVPYLVFYFHTFEGQNKILSFANQTGVPALSQPLKNFKKIRLCLPSLQEQRRIASIVETINDKIENNIKINDNLQQQLFSLYENMATASPCSKEYTLSNLCDFQEGYVNPPQTHPEYFDGEVKWLRAVDINESFIIETSRTLTKAGFESAKKSALLFEPNTIAISKSGTIGRLGIIADYMCGNRAVINIAPHDTNMLAFIYCFLKSKQREFPDMAVGSVQKNLYVSLLEPLSVSIPDNESLTAFNAVGASILGMIHNNCVENTDLANLRDTILPKLMSGELDVSSVLI